MITLLLWLLEKVIFFVCLSCITLPLVSWIDTPITCSHEDSQAKRTHKKGEGFVFDENSLRRYLYIILLAYLIFHLSTHCLYHFHEACHN